MSESKNQDIPLTLLASKIFSVPIPKSKEGWFGSLTQMQTLVVLYKENLSFNWYNNWTSRQYNIIFFGSLSHTLCCLASFILYRWPFGLAATGFLAMINVPMVANSLLCILSFMWGLCYFVLLTYDHKNHSSNHLVDIRGRQEIEGQSTRQEMLPWLALGKAKNCSPTCRVSCLSHLTKTLLQGDLQYILYGSVAFQ